MKAGLRSFVMVWMGQTISIMGSSMTGFALSVWVFQQAHSVTKFTMISVVGSLATILAAPYSGVIIDRWDRRRVMIGADLAAAGVSLVVLTLAATGALRIWQVYPLVMVTSVLANLQSPAFSAAVTLLIPKAHYGRAEGMRQFGEAGAAIVAPLLAGVLVVTIGLAGVIAIDLGTFLIGGLMTLLVRIPSPAVDASAVSWMERAAYGYHYLRQRPPLLRLLAYISSVNFVIVFAMILFLPLVLSLASPKELGTILSLAAAGSIVGSLAVSVTGGPRRRILGVVACGFLAGPSIVLIAFGRSWPLIALGAFLVAVVIPLANASSQAIWQSKVAPAVQGRVFAFRRVVAQATSPVAFLLAGPLSDRVFGPLMAPSGALAASLGPWIGVGKERGIAAIYLILGPLTVGLGIWGALSPRLQSVEDDVPDAVIDPLPAGPEPVASVAADLTA